MELPEPHSRIVPLIQTLIENVFNSGLFGTYASSLTASKFSVGVISTRPIRISSPAVACVFEPVLAGALVRR